MAQRLSDPPRVRASPDKGGVAIVMTLHKLHAGDGYTYLTRQVAVGDEGRSPGQQLADYYTASGNPPGRWVGAGAADLGVSGRVREDQMRALFGRGMHPDADQIITLETAAGSTPEEAERAAKLGRAFPRYTPLPPRSDRVAARLAAFATENGHPPSPVVRSKIEAQESRRERRAVAGYDLVFTPVKSASLLWALGSARTRQAVEDAHHDAVADTLAWLEKETAFARIGDKGEAQVDTRGFLATAFDHLDSRAGDPDLHTHLAISNKVRARADHPDGRPRWLSLDARVLHAAAVAASERYNTRFEDALTRRLPVAFSERGDSVRDHRRVIREITGVPTPLVRHFSKRRALIEDRYLDLAVDYRHTHGREPSPKTQLKLAEQATLETRDAKTPPTSLAEKLTAWRAEAVTVVGDGGVEHLEQQVLGHKPAITGLQDLPIDELAGRVTGVVSAEKATWTRWNITAETERQLRPLCFTTPADRGIATRLVIDRVLAPDHAVQLTADGLETVLSSLATEESGDDANRALAGSRRDNGESVLVEHGSTRYTTQDLLDAEQRLLDHAGAPTRHGLTHEAATKLINAFEQRHGVTLDDGQRALAMAFTTDPRRLVAGIGPAGAGKTTAMRAVAQTWRTTGRRIVPLAPSATAVEVLGDELGCRAENLHKFQHTHTARAATDKAGGAPRRGQAGPDDEWFVLQPGDLVLVDEAGMAGTRALDWITGYARQRGALVRLLGDPAQLTSVEAGGALRLIAHDAGAVELSDIHRFTDPAESTATIGLREGLGDAIGFYDTHHRIRAGTGAAMLETAYDAWARDTAAGLTSLLIAASTRDVTALNTRARRQRVATGAVEETGIELDDGSHAGVGDRIVTRKNQRQLSNRSGTRFVKNGDTWTVTRRHRNGDLTVRDNREDSADRPCRSIRLPHDYVTRHVELAYATTTARAQGRTVETAHVLVDDTLTREALYVAASRARKGSHLYIETEHHLGLDAERPPRPTLEAHDVLRHILARPAAEITATEVRRNNTRPAPRRQAGTRPSLTPTPPVRAPQRARAPSGISP
jgi:conjugative relaxase-like TrwC/TraI family protein